MAFRRALATAPLLSLLLFGGLILATRSQRHLTAVSAILCIVPVTPILTFRMAERLLRLLPALVFGITFLFLIHGLERSGGGVHWSFRAEALAYVLFLSLIFLYITALSGFFLPGAWHQALSFVRFPPRYEIVLFGGVAALAIIVRHVSEAALVAKLHYGRSWNPARRFVVLIRAAVPLFYGSLIKLESGLISLDRRDVYLGYGVQVPYGSLFYLRAWLSIGMTILALAGLTGIY